ncbi:MAG: KdsC family phosphatase [Candidatus Goldiibacteriota bacterium]
MMGQAPDNILKIKLFILDVDGVLTDGGIIIGSNGEEYKKFNVKDGGGISIARKAGFKFAIISGRYSKVIDVRAKELKIDMVYQGAARKTDAYEDIKKKTGLKDSEICFIGDEIIDIPAMQTCGFSSAPKDAVREAKETADYVCETGGGGGCVREVIEMVLKKQKLWTDAVKRYLGNEE